MADILKFDEINKKSSKKRNIIPIKQYFEEMELSDEQIEKRIRLANELREVFAYVFLFMKADFVAGNSIDKDYYSEMLNRRYRDALLLFGIFLDDIMKNHIREISEEIIDTSVENTDDQYIFSQDRSIVCSENETNTIYNYDEYRQAIANGYTRKQWITEKDDRVRRTHSYVDNEIIGIHDLFEVGDSMMLFPKDTSQGASPDEIINCRCTIKYLK